MCKIRRSRAAKKAIQKTYCHLGDKNECGFTDVCKKCNGRNEIYNYRKCGVADYEKGFNDGWDALADHLCKIPFDTILEELTMIIKSRDEEEQKTIV